MKKIISITQLKVIKKMEDGQWYSSYSLQCRISTLYALLEKKIVEIKRRKGSLFFPRSNIEFRLLKKYRELKLNLE